MIARLRQPAIRLLEPSTSSFTLTKRCLPPHCIVPRHPNYADHPRPFTSNPILTNNPINHYEVLRVPPDCTKAELKKQFYTLSKETHPDINKSDPDASRRFSQISESYSVLANPERRRRYDRDVARTQHASSSPRPHHRGSYAGSRPASGLSKRRGAFRGPPPSFYAHDGNPKAGHASSSSSSSSTAQGGAGAPGGTFNASAFGDLGPDFDSRPIHRTQTVEDMRRQNRRAAAAAEAAAQAEDEHDFWVRFVVVSGVVVLGITVATIIGSMQAPKGGLLRGDGSRRSEARNEWTKG